MDLDNSLFFHAQEQERELERAAAQALEAGAAAEAQHGEEAARLAEERARLQKDAAEVLGSLVVTLRPKD